MPKAKTIAEVVVARLDIARASATDLGTKCFSQMISNRPKRPRFSQSAIQGEGRLFLVQTGTRFHVRC